MMPDNMRDDSLDPVIRDRRYTSKPAVDMLNSTVPEADEGRRDALEQRLMARVLEGKAPGKNRPMIHNAAIQGAYETPRRFRISTSLLLTAAVGMLFTTVLVYSGFNRPPSEESPWAVAPINRDQDAAELPATATPMAFDGPVTMPPTIPATGVPSNVTDVPDSGFTATPMPFNGAITEFSATATPVPFDMNNCPVDAGCDMIVSLPSERIEAVEGVSLAAGQRLDLLVSLVVLSEDGSSETEVSFVPVSEGGEVLAISDGGTVTLRVPTQDGIVLTWLLNDTAALISYALAE